MVRLEVNSLEEFQKILMEHETKTCTKYVCIRSERPFTEEKFTPTDKMKIHWKENVPYFHIGSRTYACHQGADLNKSKKRAYVEKRDSRFVTDHVVVQQRNLAQPTKKVGCPVVIKITRIYSIPDMKVEYPNKRNKSKTSNEIKKKIKDNEAIQFTTLYLFELPEEKDHKNHPQGNTTGLLEPLDFRVREKIKELFLQGYRNKMIKELVENFACEELGQTDRLRRRFFPDTQTIRNVVHSARKELGLNENEIELNNTINSLRKILDRETGVSPETFEEAPEGEEEESYTLNCDEAYTLNCETPSQNVDTLGVHEIEVSTERENYSEVSETERGRAYRNLALPKGKRKLLIKECNSLIRSLQSHLKMLDETELGKIKSKLKDVCHEASAKVTLNKENGLPVESELLIRGALPNQQPMKRQRLGLAAHSKKNDIDLLNTLIQDATGNCVTFEIPEVFVITTPR